jgi:hypothetical protein
MAALARHLGRVERPGLSSANRAAYAIVSRQFADIAPCGLVKDGQEFFEEIR